MWIVLWHRAVNDVRVSTPYSSKADAEASARDHVTREGWTRAFVIEAEEITRA